MPASAGATVAPVARSGPGGSQCTARTGVAGASASAKRAPKPRHETERPARVVRRSNSPPRSVAAASLRAPVRVRSALAPVGRAAAGPAPPVDGEVGEEGDEPADRAGDQPGEERASRVLKPTGAPSRRRRSRSASTPQRRPAATSSSLSGQRSGRSSPSWSGLAPLSAIEPKLSPIARISATSAASEPLLAAAPRARRACPRSAAPRAPPPGSGSVRRRRPPGGRGSTGRRAGSGSGPRRSAIGRIRSSRSRPASTQPSGRKRRWSCWANAWPGQDVVPEQAAVVDDPRDHPDAVLGGGVEAELAGPRLERVEDHHRPVDPLAEALEAVDQVEREAVGRAGGDRRSPRSARRRAAPPSRPRPPRSESRCDRGCAAAARRRSRRRAARGSPRSPGAGSPRTRRARAGAGR